MCEYCREYENGNIKGDEFKVEKTAGYKEEYMKYRCWIMKTINDLKAGIMISEYGMNAGYIDINYCPMCGRKLEEK